MFQISVKIEAGDYVAYNIYHRKHSLDVKCMLRTNIVILFAATVSYVSLVCSGFIGLRHSTLPDERLFSFAVLFYFGAAVLGMLLFGLLSFICRFRDIRTIKTVVQKSIASEQYYLGTVQYSVDTETVQTQEKHIETKISWRKISAFDETETHVFMMLQEGRAFILPKRAFESPADFDEFAAFCREQIQINAPKLDENGFVIG